MRRQREGWPALLEIPRTVTLADDEIKLLVQGAHDDVFRVLGPHAVTVNDGIGVVVRVFLPDAHAVRVLPHDPGPDARAMERLHEAGLFETVFADR